MVSTTHKVAGVYADRAAAREGARALREAGFSENKVLLVDRDDWELAFTNPEEIRTRSKRNALAGAGAGALIGAAGAGALAAAKVSVLAGAPLLTELAGAVIGALAGSAIAGVSSASVHEPDFRNLVREAVEQGQCLVIVRANTEAGALEAQNLIGRTTDKSLDHFGGFAH